MNSDQDREELVRRLFTPGRPITDPHERGVAKQIIRQVRRQQGRVHNMRTEIFQTSEERRARLDELKREGRRNVTSFSKQLGSKMQFCVAYPTSDIFHLRLDSDTLPAPTMEEAMNRRESFNKPYPPQGSEPTDELDTANLHWPEPPRREASFLQTPAALILAFVIFAVICIIAFFASGGHAAPVPVLHFQKMTIAQFDTHDIRSLPTRVEISGFVVYKAHEADGDIHLWICDSMKYPKEELIPGEKKRTHCAVAEAMPDLPVPAAKAVAVGDYVTVDGISRWDAEHRWSECAHPIERLSVKVAPK